MDYETDVLLPDRFSELILFIVLLPFLPILLFWTGMLMLKSFEVETPPWSAKT